MRHIQSIEIDRPVTEVYEYVTDPTRLPEWDTDIRRAGVLTEGDLRVGSRIEIERTLPPSRRYGSLRGTITDYRPSVGFAVSIDEGPMPFDLHTNSRTGVTRASCTSSCRATQAGHDDSWRPSLRR